MKKQEKMFRLVEQYQQSGATMKAFARSQGICYSSFFYWVKKHKTAKTAHSGFVPLQVAEKPKYPNQTSVVYPGGVEVKLSEFDIHKIIQLLQIQ